MKLSKLCLLGCEHFSLSKNGISTITPEKRHEFFSDGKITEWNLELHFMFLSNFSIQPKRKQEDENTFT
jgi:hypothetical protein